VFDLPANSVGWRRATCSSAMLCRTDAPSAARASGPFYDDDGEGEADAKNPNSNHDLLFHDPPRDYFGRPCCRSQR